MIVDLISFFNSHQLIVTFISHFFIFLGTFYVAIHNRNMPQWGVTPLWYVGLFAFLTCFTIVCQWYIGPEFPLSYWNLGQLAQSMVYVSLAVMSLVSLIMTVKKDIHESKKRKQVQ